MADDFSELNRLAADLTGAPNKARPFVRKALQVSAFKIKASWREKADRTGLHGYALDVTYETEEKAAEIVAEIGPTIGDAGSFGFVDEGGGNVRSAPQHAARDSLRENEDDFVTGLEIALFDATREAIE